MIIRSSKFQEGMNLTEENGELILNGVVDIEPVLSANAESKKDSSNGFSKDHSYRRVARIPFKTWIELTRRNPEMLTGDKELREKTLNKWLRSSEGKIFWTVDSGV